LEARHRSSVRIEVTRSPAETAAIGARLAATLRPGDVVVVSGELGTGKTTLIRGACRELGVRGPVPSPTFTIGRRYRGRVPISHLDLFRLDTLEGEDPALLEDYLVPEAISFIEWPQAAESELPSVVDSPGRVRRVEITHRSGDEREISVR
jgi:tRNA threonylcarbamoyladenosine biosynthesis protein TsaE